MADIQKTSVVLLSGGVGGAKIAEGLAHIDHVDLTIIGNVADDDEFHGLWVSPDIDTLVYTLSGRIDTKQGWGVADESLRALSVLTELGQDTWMTLGDRDFGLHIYRTNRLKQGHSRNEILSDICAAFKLPCSIILPTEDVIQTRVRISSGWVSFQEYFVKEQCLPEVLELKVQNIEKAKPSQMALDAIKNADIIVIAPSNPLVSILPIINIPDIGEAIKSATAPKVGMSPLIGGKTVKGPADKMMQSLGIGAKSSQIAALYRDYLDVFFIDRCDVLEKTDITKGGMAVVTDNIFMRNKVDKIALAKKMLQSVNLLGSVENG